MSNADENAGLRGDWDQINGGGGENGTDALNGSLKQRPSKALRATKVLWERVHRNIRELLVRGGRRGESRMSSGCGSF